MSDQPKNGAGAQPPLRSRTPLPPAAQAMLTDLISQGLGAQERRCLEAGVEVQQLIRVLLNHAASLAAVVAPPGMRAEVVAEMVASIPSLVRDHVGARTRTPGGVWLPPGVARAVARAG